MVGGRPRDEQVRSAVAVSCLAVFAGGPELPVTWAADWSVAIGLQFQPSSASASRSHRRWLAERRSVGFVEAGQPAVAMYRRCQSSASAAEGTDRARQGALPGRVESRAPLHFGQGEDRRAETC